MFYRVLLALTFIVLNVSNVIAQTAEVDIPEPTFKIPSAESVKLIRSVDTPISYHTGVPDIKVPIYTLNEGGLEIPIYLEYNASGIKIDDESGILGLGWRLVAQPKITRVVKDGIDGNDSYITGHYRDYEAGNFDEDTDCPDTQPDIFYYSLPNRSGKFLFNHQGIPLTFPASNIKISPELLVQDMRDSEFEIKDNYGYKFIMSEPEVTSSTMKEAKGDVSAINYFDGIKGNYTWLDPRNPQCVNGSYVSTWHATTVLNHNHETLYNFNYIDNSYQRVRYNESQRSSLHDASVCDIDRIRSRKINQNTSSIGLKLLESITNNSVEVEFSYVTDARSETGKLLNSILVKDKSGQTKLTHTFEYSFKTTGVNGVSADRVFLKRVFLNGDAKKTFHYNSETALPSEFFPNSPYVDSWGYFKNSTNQLESKLPSTSFVNQDNGNSIGGQLDKSTPDLSSTKVGVLESITDELGYSTHFVYGQNYHQNIPWGGLRIEEIYKQSSSGQKVSKRQYIYEFDSPQSITESGYAVAWPQHWSQYKEIFWNTSGGTNNCPYTQDPSLLEADVVYVSSEPLPTNYNLQYNVIYDEVIEKIEDHGRIVRNFTSTSDYAHTPLNVAKVVEYPSGDNHVVLNEISDLTGAFVKDFLFGKLENRSVYDEAGSLIEEENINYELIDTGTKLMAAVTSYSKGLGESNWQTGEVTQIGRFSIPSEFFVRTSRKQSKYDNGTEYNEVNQQFTYNHIGQLREVSETGTSPEFNKRVEYKYPSDFSSSYIYQICKFNETSQALWYKYEPCYRCGERIGIENDYDDYFDGWADCEDINTSYQLPVCSNINDIVADCNYIIEDNASEEAIALWLLNLRNAIATPVSITTRHNGKIKKSQHTTYKLEVYDPHGDATNANEELLFARVLPKEISAFGNKNTSTIGYPEIQGSSNPFTYNADNNYITRKTYKYRNLGAQDRSLFKLKEVDMHDGVTINYRYDDNLKLNIKYETPVKETFDIFIDDFEGENNLSQEWTSTSTTTSEAYAGDRSLPAVGVFNFQIGNSSEVDYTISFAYKSSSSTPFQISGVNIVSSSTTPLANGWELYQASFYCSNSELLSLEFNQTYIDNFMLKPAALDAKIVSQDPVYGTESVTNKNGLTEFYQRDDRGRLIKIINHKGEILQEFEYNLKGSN